MDTPLVGTTKPSDCALVFALPQSWEQCVRDLLAREEPAPDARLPLDFAAHSTLRDPKWRERTGDDAYHKPWNSSKGEYGLQEAIADVLTSARKAGVTVIEAATLSAFASLGVRYRVITLVSHWKGHTVYPDDVLDWAGLVHKLTHPTDGILRWITEHLSSGALQCLLDGAAPEPTLVARRGAFLREFNRVLKSERYGKTAIKLELLDGYHNRNALDAALSHELRPGNRAEFRDGMYPVEAIAACIPESFAGVFDLTICNSIFLAEGVKACSRRRDLLILCNTAPTPLKLRLLLYKHVILEVARTNQDYEEVERDLRTTLLFGRPLTMTNLKDVLQHVTAPTDLELGEGDLCKLRGALQDVRRTNERYFILVMAVLVVFFLASWVLVFLNRSEPTTLTAVFAALGGSVFGGIYMMARLWQQKVATDIILATLNDLSPAERKLVMKRILEKL